MKRISAIDTRVKIKFENITAINYIGWAFTWTEGIVEYKYEPYLKRNGYVYYKVKDRSKVILFKDNVKIKEIIPEI